MTIYELLERLLIGPVLRADEEQAAVQMIHELRDMNALGTTTSNIDVASHECYFVSMYVPGLGSVTRCQTCGKDITYE